MAMAQSAEEWKLEAENDSDDNDIIVVSGSTPSFAAGRERSASLDGSREALLVEADDAVCSQCAEGGNTHSCTECGLLCAQCVRAHIAMKCFGQHTLSALFARADYGQKQNERPDCNTNINGTVDSSSLSTAATGTLPTRDEACERRRDRTWHWRWSESVPDRPVRAPQLKMSEGGWQNTRTHTSWSIGGGHSSPLHRPQSVAVSADGLLYVCDRHSDSKIKVFNTSDGSFVRYLGADFGTGEGQLDCPTAIALDESRVYVADATSNRIQGFLCCFLLQL